MLWRQWQSKYNATLVSNCNIELKATQMITQCWQWKGLIHYFGFFILFIIYVCNLFCLLIKYIFLFLTVRTDTLSDMVAHMTDSVGLVHQMPFSCDRTGLPATLEKVSWFTWLKLMYYSKSYIKNINLLW